MNAPRASCLVSRFFLGLLLAAAFAGCISNRGGVKKEEGVPWKIGEMSRRDVVARWGAPDAVLDDVWIWRTRQTGGGKLKASFMMIGATVKNLGTSILEYRMKFDENSRLSSFTTVDYAPGVSDWSLNPWD